MSHPSHNFVLPFCYSAKISWRKKNGGDKYTTLKLSQLKNAIGKFFQTNPNVMTAK